MWGPHRDIDTHLHARMHTRAHAVHFCMGIHLLVCINTMYSRSRSHYLAAEPEALECCLSGRLSGHPPGVAFLFLSEGPRGVCVWERESP
jgi:hypothetical protein